MKLPWDKPAAPPQPAAALPVLQAILVEPVLYNGNPIKWNITLQFDRKNVWIGSTTTEEKARELAKNIGDGLFT